MQLPKQLWRRYVIYLTVRCKWNQPKRPQLKAIKNRHLNCLKPLPMALASKCCCGGNWQFSILQLSSNRFVCFSDWYWSNFPMQRWTSTIIVDERYWLALWWQRIWIWKQQKWYPSPPVPNVSTVNTWASAEPVWMIRMRKLLHVDV